MTFGQLRCLFAAISAARARALLYMHGSTQRRPSPSQTRRQSGPPRSRHWAPRRVQHGKLGNGGQMAGGHGVAVRRARMHRCRQQVREQRGRRPYRGARLAARLRRARGRSRRAGRRRRVGGAAALPANTQTAVKHRAAAHSGLNKPDDAARCMAVTHPPFDACPKWLQRQAPHGTRCSPGRAGAAGARARPCVPTRRAPLWPARQTRPGRGAAARSRPHAAAACAPRTAPARARPDQANPSPDQRLRALFPCKINPSPDQHLPTLSVGTQAGEGRPHSRAGASQAWRPG